MSDIGSECFLRRYLNAVNRTKISDVNERLERAAFRYGISLEFAMAVVATEVYMAPKVSHARRSINSSWRK